MKIAYFDCQFGAAGDMLNAALIAAGVDEQKWQEQLEKVALAPGEFTVRVSDVVRCSITCKKVDVFNAHGHRCDAQPEPEHEHEHEHEPGHLHTHRGLQDILALINCSEITDSAKALASRIFKRLARAEGQVHGVSPDQVHFHEVGALDAVVDIVGFAIGYDMLAIEKSYASAVAFGSGKVVTQHGLFPIPGPATAYLVQEAGAALAASKIPFECLTPTGAAILCEVVSEWGGQPGFARLLGTGYGAGTKDPSGWPNACRILVGPAAQNGAMPAAAADFDTDTIAVLEANLDDLSPQALAYAMERLLAEGALDVSVVPSLMKKGRSGHLLTVLARPEDRIALEKTLLTQTSSIGVRWYEARRAVARRQFQQIQLAQGEAIRIKLAFDNHGRVVNAQPEYDDCAAYATKHGLPLKEVTNQALVRYLANQKTD